MRKHIFVMIAVAVLGCTLLVACGKLSAKNNSKQQSTVSSEELSSEIGGEWENDTETAGESAVKKSVHPLVGTWMMRDNETGEIQQRSRMKFKSDGTVLIITAGTNTTKSYWKEEEGRLMIRGDLQSEWSDMNAELVDDTITFRYDNGSMVEWVRQSE